MNENNQLSKSDRIAERIRPEIASETAIAKGGMMAFRNIEQIMEFGKVMSIASVAIPRHLRDNPGACLAVAIQASEWEMSPFSVANKTYVVNDRLAYEAQLINAVILKRAPIMGRFKVEYKGDGPGRQCTVRARLKDGDEVEYTSPKLSDIPVKNSPLWKGDPDQQLFYYSSRAMCRRHFPDVILGIYAPDEIEELKMVEGAEVPAIKFGEPIEQPAETQPSRDVETASRGGQNPSEAERQPAAENAGTVTETNEPPTLLQQLRVKLLHSNVTEAQFKRYLVVNGHIEPSDRFEKMTDEKLQDIVNSYESLLEDVKASLAS